EAAVGGGAARDLFQQAALSGGHQRRGKAERRSRSNFLAPARAGATAGPLGRVRRRDAAPRRHPLRRAGARQGAARFDSAHLQGERGARGRGWRQPEQGARGGGRLMDFSGKVVLVTGGSRGIGRACAVAFAERGARVAIGYAANEAEANHTLSMLRHPGKAIRLDAADAAACARAVESVVADFGRLDVLVNNAGVAVDGLVVRVKDEDWDKQLDTNLKGAFALIRAAARPMMKQRGGAIVNVTSVVGETGNSGQAA